MTNIAIVVNSCYKYYEKTIPKILENLDNFNDLFIVVGESETEFEYNCTWMGASIHFRKWANMDNNGLIWVVSEDGRKTLSQYDWIFYIHDTCVPSKDFVRSVHDTFEKYKDRGDSIKLNNVSMSIGYYNLSRLWSEDVSNYIVSNVNYDKSEKVIKDIKSRVEDTVFTFIGNRCFTIPNNNPITINDVENIYGTGTKRIIEKWQEPFFDKIKANYTGTFEIIDL